MKREWCEDVHITQGRVNLPGYLSIPERCQGLVLFAHGSGSSRNSPRNIQVAECLYQGGLGTLLFDLLSANEAQTRETLFNVPLLANRLMMATKWVTNWAAQQNKMQNLPIGYFGASTGAAAALWAAALSTDSHSDISAIVSRGGRPDLAIPRLKEVMAPTLLIVGENDDTVLEVNQEALKYIRNGSLVIIPGASHLFEEPGALEEVARAARNWFTRYFELDMEKRLKGKAA